MTRGEIFNPFGYALAFRRGESTEYMAFSQAIQFIKEQGVLDTLDKCALQALKHLMHCFCDM